MSLYIAKDWVATCHFTLDCYISGQHNASNNKKTYWS